MKRFTHTLLAIAALLCAVTPTTAQVTNVPCNQLPALTGDVTTAGAACATTLAAGSASNLNSGTLPAGRLPALTGDVTSSAGSASTSYNSIVPVAKGGTGAAYGALYLAGYALNVDLNSVADTEVTLTLPTGLTGYRLVTVQLYNHGTTASLTTAVGGVFSSTGGGGTTIASALALSGCTQNAINTAGAMCNFGTPVSSAKFNYTTVYVRITVAQGAAATGDVFIYVYPLP